MMANGKFDVLLSIVLIFFLLVGIGHSQPSPIALPSVVGDTQWDGYYTCAQGQTRLRLKMQVDTSGLAEAVFEFGPSPTNYNVPTGSFVLAGSMRSDGALLLSPIRWISQPPGYVMVGLDGTIRGGIYRGSIVGGDRCGEFMVARQQLEAMRKPIAPSDNPPQQYPAPAANLLPSPQTAHAAKTPAPVESDMHVGPSFSCAQADTPIAQLICSSPDLSRSDLVFVQVYYALRQQTGPAGWAALRAEILDFDRKTVELCGIPAAGPLPPNTTELATCLSAAYAMQREAWLSRLEGVAAEEARRPIEEHIALQRDLQVEGFLPPSEIIDGVYGSATRNAIFGWQQNHGRNPTGFVGDADATLIQQQSGLTQLSQPIGAPSSPARDLGVYIPLAEEGGTLVVPVLINNAIKLNFVVDSGAADVTVPADVVMTLIRAGTISRSDFIGTRTYVLADGSRVPSAVFRLHTLNVGSLQVENITATVGNANGTLLLGQSFLSRFKSWSIDNQRQVLVLNQ